MEIAIIPKWLIKLLNPKDDIQYQLNILLSNIMIFLLFLLLKGKVIEIMNSIPHFCLFDKVIGFQCPVCGTTRALCEISYGNFKNAYKLNISSFFVLIFFFLQIPLRIFALYDNNYIDKINLISKRSSFVLIVLIVVIWIFKIF